MLGFVYFVPCAGLPTLADLQAAGLGYAFDGPGYAMRQCVGPTGGAGCLVHPTPLADGEEIGYLPARQTWAPVPGSPAWVGWDPQALPGPEALARVPALRVGPAFYTLGDGREWLCPTLMTEDGGLSLDAPKVRRLSADGRIEKRIAAGHEALYLLADEVREAIQAKRNPPEDRQWEICVAALRCNYRLGPVEISALGLLGDTVCGDQRIDAALLILWALVDRLNWKEEGRQ